MTRWIALLCLIFGLATTACADENERALVSGDRAYLLRSPRVIATGYIGNKAVSPDGTSLLFEQGDSPFLGAFGTMLWQDGVFPDCALTLATATRDKPVVIWKSANTETDWWMVEKMYWLAGNETALVLLKHGHLEAKPADPAQEADLSFGTDLLIVNIRRQSARFITINTPDEGGSVFLRPSPTRPEAILIQHTHKDDFSRTSLVTQSGVGKPFHATDRIPMGGWGWAGADGSEIRATTVTKAGNYRDEQHVIYDRKAGKVCPSDKPVWYSGSKVEKPIVSEEPVRVVAERGALAVGSVKRGSDCVVVENRERTERVVLAADAKPVAILAAGENRKIVYMTDTALYAVTVLPRTYTEYAKYMREVIERNASDIYSAIISWREKNAAATFPQFADPLSLVGVNEYWVRTDYALRDPRTGAMAFQSRDTGKPDATGNVPVFVLKTSFGQLTYYVVNRHDEQSTVWDTPEPPAKP